MITEQKQHRVLHVELRFSFIDQTEGCSIQAPHTADQMHLS